MIFEGLARVSADGGPVQPATLVDFDRGENSHRWPVFLPDGIHFLFFVRASVDERRGVYVARIDRPASTPGSPLFRSESEAVFVPTSGRERGVLLSTADGQLQARPFDAAALRLVGDPRTLPVAAGANTPYHPAMLSASADLLATVAMPMAYGVRLATVARDGTAVRMSERQPQNWPRLSPDGRRMARQIDRSGSWQSRHLGRGPPGRQPRPRHHGHRFRSLPGVVSGWAAVGIRIRHLQRAAVEHCGGRWHRRDAGTTVSGRVLRADRLVSRRALSHRQHTPGHDWCWTTCGACRSRPAGRPSRFFPGRSPSTTRGYRRTDNGSPTFRRRLADRSSPSARCRAHRGVSWCPATAAANPSGAAMGGSFSTSIVEGRLRGRSVQRQPTGELTLGVAHALSVPLIGSGHWGTQDDVSPDGQHVYFIDRTPAPRPSDIRVVIGWRALLK